MNLKLKIKKLRLKSFVLQNIFKNVYCCCNVDNNREMHENILKFLAGRIHLSRLIYIQSAVLYNYFIRRRGLLANKKCKFSWTASQHLKYLGKYSISKRQTIGQLLEIIHCKQLFANIHAGYYTIDVNLFSFWNLNTKLPLYKGTLMCI